MENINKRLLYLIIPSLVLLAAGCDQPLAGTFNIFPKTNDKACTQEAKLCSDGSSVGRTGPNCEWAKCPDQSQTTPPTTPPVTNSDNSGVEGLITYGPTCPVQHNPPEPGCADKPYKTDMTASGEASPQIVKYFSSGTDGKFRISLTPGKYIIASADTKGGLFGARFSQEVTVEKNKYTQINFTVDSGIR